MTCIIVEEGHVAEGGGSRINRERGPDKTARTGNRSAWWQSAIWRFCWIAAPLWNERFAPNHRRRFGISRVVFEGSCISPRDTAVSFRLYLSFFPLPLSFSPSPFLFHRYNFTTRGGNGFVRVSFLFSRGRDFASCLKEK